MLAAVELLIHKRRSNTFYTAIKKAQKSQNAMRIY